MPPPPPVLILRLAQRRPQILASRGEILQKIDVHVEADQESQILLAKHRTDELSGNFLLGGKHARFAAAGIHQQAQGERLNGVSLVVLDGLRLAVFKNLELILRQIRHQGPMLVLGHEVQVHDVDVDLESPRRVLLPGVFLLLARLSLL